MTDVAVIIPWRGGCPWRERALGWVFARYAADHPGWPIILGESPDGPFSRTQAIRAAAARTDATTLVIADGDVYTDPGDAVTHAGAHGWAIPHLLLHRLSAPSTTAVLRGSDWRGLPLSTDNRQDAWPYTGHETDTLVVMRRDVFEDVPPDPRFVGWGQEGDAWRLALRLLVGKPWRGRADLVHLWHPAQQRKSRVVGNDANLALYRRYGAARRKPEAMRALLDEAFAWR